MNETDVRIKEDANDLVYDPNQEAAQPVAATAPAAENPAAAPVDAAPMTEPQPMTDSMPPVAPAVEATPTEVADAQEDAMAPEAPAEDAATDAASEALNAAADASDDNIIELTVKFDKRDLLKDGFLAPDAEAAAANPAAQIAANPNVEIPQEPLTSVGAVSESLDSLPNSLDALKESFFKDFFAEMAKSVIDSGKALEKDEAQIQADLDVKLKTLLDEPMFQGIEISDDIKKPFSLVKEEKAEVEEAENPYDEVNDDKDTIKNAGEEPGKSEFKDTEIELPLHKEELASEIAKSKSDTYDAVSEDKDVFKTAGEDEEVNEALKDDSEKTEMASDVLGKDVDDYKSVDEDKDIFKNAVSDSGAVTPVKESEEHEEDPMAEVAEGSGEHLEDVANADMGDADIPVEEFIAEEHVDDIPESEVEEEAKEEEKDEECKDGECEDKSAEDLLTELDNILSDIYNGPEVPAYNVNLNVNTDDKDEALEGAVRGLQDIAAFVDAVLKDEAPTDDEDSEEENPDVKEAPEEEVAEEPEDSEEVKEPEEAEDSEEEDSEEEEEKIEESVEDKPEGLRIEDGYVYVDDDLVGVLGKSGEAIYNPLDDDHPEVAEYFMAKDYIVKFRATESAQRIKEGYGAGYELQLFELKADLDNVKVSKDPDTSDVAFEVGIVPGSYEFTVDHPLWGGKGSYTLKEGTLYGILDGEPFEDEEFALMAVKDDLCRYWEGNCYWSVKDYVGGGYSHVTLGEDFTIGDGTKDISAINGDTNVVILKMHGVSEDLSDIIENIQNRQFEDDYLDDDSNYDEENTFSESVEECPAEGTSCAVEEEPVEEEAVFSESEDCDYLIRQCEARIKERRSSLREARTGNSKFNEALKQAPQKTEEVPEDSDSWRANRFIDRYKESRSLNFKELLKKGFLG